MTQEAHHNSHSKTIKKYILLVLTFVSLLLVFLLPSIPQDLNYHQFADNRTLLLIPNFWNVVSNVPFFFVAVLGFLALRREWCKGNLFNWQEGVPFFTLFAGLFLTGIGSAYYHWLPTNASLVWDRIPMTIVFMSLLSMTLMERVSFKIGFWLLFPLILLGIGSVYYWQWTESFGQGDLRLYYFVQFYPAVLILVILALFPNPYPPTKAYLLMLLFYGIAKIFEFSDLSMYHMCFISGHTLKHLAAAMSAYYIVTMLNSIEKHTYTT